MEEWKRIIGYEGFYEVSNEGRIRNRHGRIMKTEINHCGYERIMLSKKRVRETYSVHRLVAMHFFNVLKEKNEVNHIDGNKLNNHSDNLEFTTRSENIKHSFYHLGHDCLGNGNINVYCETLNLFANSFNEMGTVLLNKGYIASKGSFQVKCSRKLSRGIKMFEFFGFNFEILC